MPHPLEVFRARPDGALSNLSSGTVPAHSRGGGNEMIFKVPSILNHSVILNVASVFLTGQN